MVNGVIFAGFSLIGSIHQSITRVNKQNTRNACICLFKLKLRICPCLAFHYTGSETIGNSQASGYGFIACQWQISISNYISVSIFNCTFRVASVGRKCRRSVGNINPQVSVYLVRVCVRQLSSQIGFVDGSEKRSGDRERITVRGDRAGQGLFEQVVIQSSATAARRWAGSISADACNAEKVQLCRDHPHTVYRF